MRPIADADLPAVLEVYRQCQDFLALEPDPQAPPEMIAAYRALALRQGAVYCGIFIKPDLAAGSQNPSGLVGILDYVPNYRADPGVVFIELLMLGRPYRGQGLGQAAINWMLAEGNGKIRTLQAAVQTNNPAAIRFWQRLGFRITGPAAPQEDGTVTYPLAMNVQPEGQNLPVPLPPLIYTLCFLTRGDDVLMLHRRNSPNQGLWNGVGGRIEPGESPLACILREVEEETGYRLASARFCGLLTWEGFEIPPAGLYIFTAPTPDGEPRSNSEGELEWKPRQWVFTAPETVSNIHHFAPPVLSGAPPQVYHFAYQKGEILWHEIRPCPNSIF